ncbi:MAG TPA: ABC transporter substrate-binding protein [Chloroflexota bacterium]|nr:ABC transporter substrate-binding protein [Chloroflexota bacterium]
MSARPHRPIGLSSHVISRTLIVASFISGLALLTPHMASAQHPAASFVDQGTLVYLDPRTAGDIDPASDETASNDLIARTVGEPLVAFDGASDTTYRPVLATRWTVNADHSVYTFYLRHGVRFHTGRCCLTAADVKYSIGRTITLNLAASYVFSRFMSNPNKQIKIIDPYTVEFDLGRPQPLFLGAVASFYTGLILDSQALKAHQKNHDMGHDWAQYHDAGTGPYMIKSWQIGQQVTLDRFPSYWGGWSGPHFSAIVDRTVVEATTRRELVERGQADLTYNLTPQDYNQLRKNPRVQVVIGPSTQIDYLMLNDSGPLASPAARQGLSYAFPYDAYIKAAWLGYAKRAYGVLPSTILGYDPHMFHYTTDLNKAKALLAKAGVTSGSTLTYSYVSGQFYFQIAGEVLQAQLQQIGINLKISQLDQASYNTMVYSNSGPSKLPNIMIQRWWPDYNDPWDYSDTLLDSAAAGAAGNNGGYYHNKQVDALLAKMKTAGGEALIHYTAELLDLTTRVDPAGIWIDQPAQVVVAAHNLKGIVINPIAIETYDFYSMHR